MQILKNLSVAICLLGSGLTVSAFSMDTYSYRSEQDSIEIRLSGYEPMSYSDFITYSTRGNFNTFNALSELQKTDEHIYERLIQLSYEKCSPIIFKPAPAISTNDYSLNLLWLHSEPLTEDSQCSHIMGQDDELLYDKVINPITDWHEQQLFASINFWFDSEMIPGYQLAILNTQSILAQYGVNLKQVKFRDIREIEVVTEQSRLFGPDIPIYYRVDLAKFLIGHHVLDKDGVQYAVVSDSDVVAITNSQLFDFRTLHQLESLGSTFGSNKDGFNENSFMMLKKDTISYDASKTMSKRAIGHAIKKLDDNIPLDAQDIFREYFCYFPDDIDKLYKQKNGTLYYKGRHPHYSQGKPMIFPKSQFGTSGYNDHETKTLRLALYRGNNIKKPYSQLYS